MKGRGSAEATLDSAVSEADGETRVDVVTELVLRGAVAQYGRGVVGDVASRLTAQFADCIATQLASPAPAEPGQPPSTAHAVEARPIGGIGLLLGALWRSLLRRFGRR